MSIILAAESSCDESAIAIYSTQQGIMANEVYSQIPLHQKYGGVVPELAARDHIHHLPKLLHGALEKSGISFDDVDVFAYTAGPGLLGSLMTGATFIHSIAYALNKPILPIHHMEGHLLSPMLAEGESPIYPFIALLVSGGHTQIVAVKSPGNYELLGQTLDDAVGEAFDKTAKLMGLGYPGGPELSALATQGNPEKFSLPRPMTNRAGMDMSFSGLKTQTRLLIEQETLSDRESFADIAASFEYAVIDTLMIKCKRAWQYTGYRDLVIAGGVSANQTLRDKIKKCADSLGKRVFFPPIHLCGDNALMIAYAAAQRMKQMKEASSAIEVKARWLLTDIEKMI